MQKRGRALLVHLIWAIAGLAIGATAALLWVMGFKPDWIEATGTWFGAIATVLALLWAVQTFRADQAHRDSLRNDAEDERDRQRVAREWAIQDDADRVALALRGGGGYGNPGDKSITGVHLTVHNDTDQPVTVTDVRVNGLTLRRAVPVPLRIKPRDIWTDTIDTDPAPIGDDELSGMPLRSYGGSITFDVHGRSWTKSDGQLTKAADRA